MALAAIVTYDGLVQSCAGSHSENQLQTAFSSDTERYLHWEHRWHMPAHQESARTGCMKYMSCDRSWR